jgi:hypothetical protein
MGRQCLEAEQAKGGREEWPHVPDDGEDRERAVDQEVVEERRVARQL